MAPNSLINEAESKAADWQIAKALAGKGYPPKNWSNDHPCEFGVFQKDKNSYCVAPLFPKVLTDLGNDGFRIVYRTDR